MSGVKKSIHYITYLFIGFMAVEFFVRERFLKNRVDFAIQPVPEGYESSRNETSPSTPEFKSLMENYVFY